MSDTDYDPSTDVSPAPADTTPLTPAPQPSGWDAPLGGQRSAFRQREQRQREAPIAITDASQYETLLPGQKYIDPEGTARQKPYTVEDKFSYDQVPEGATYVDPEGTSRTKPVFEGIGYTAQTLHSMAVTDKEKRKILEKFYPGQVQGEGDDMYVVDPNGTYRKPGRLNTVRDALGAVGGNIMPMGLGGIGAVAGGAEGGLPGAAGAALGTMGGQYFNDIILKLNGVYDRTAGEEALDKTVGPLMAAGGEGAGRVIGGFVPSVKAGTTAIKNAGPDVMNKFLGTGAEDLAQYRRIGELGETPSSNPAMRLFGLTETTTAPGISTIAKEAPHLQNVQELFHEGFDTSQPRLRAAETAYNKMSAPLLEKQGVGSVDDLLSAEPKVSVQQTGEQLTAKAMQDAGNLDAAMAERIAEAKRAIAEQGAVMPAQREQLLHVARAQQENATQLINGALQNVERNAEQAVQRAAQGANSGDLWQAVGEQIRQVRQAMGERYRQNAQTAYETVPRGAGVNARPLSEAATDFIETMPEEFRSRNPALVRQIEQLGQRTDEAGGAVPATVTLEQLHNMRSALRSSADYYDLPSDFKNGALKYFAGQVDNLMQGLGSTSQFRTAIDLLNENDRWFAQERPVFNARQMQTVLRGLEAGEPADPALLYQAMIKPGATDLIGRTEQVVGPNLWNGVRAAQRQQWLQNARAGQFDRTVDAGKFAREVIEAHNEGTLFPVQGREQGEQMLQLAQQIGMMEGKLPVTFRPNDTAFDVFRQARMAAESAEREANVDPIKVLARETRRIEGQARAEQAAQRRADPLRFLSDKSFGATRAVNKILGDEDLILATASRFGEQSPEFNALRQVWTERIFRGTLEPGKRLDKASPQVQKLMLGVNLDTAKKIAEDMEFIMGSKALGRGDNTAGGMSVMSKIEHPIAGKTISRMARVIPGANTAGRATLGAYYAFMNKVLESPALARWLEKSYTNPEARPVIRAELQKVLQRSGSIGATTASGLYRQQQQGLSLPQ